MSTADDTPDAATADTGSDAEDMDEPTPAPIGGGESSGASTGTDPLGLGTLDPASLESSTGTGAGDEA